MIIKLFENFNSIKSIEDLKSLLDEYGINSDNWGKSAGSKHINSLYNEIKNKECTIEIVNGLPMRNVEVATVDVTYKGRKLKEDYQQFTDGRTRKRYNQSSCSEKMHLGEMHLDAAIRCLREELGIEDIKASQLRNYRKEEVGPKDSMSYPGLQTYAVGHKYDIELTDSRYDPHGYIEIQKDKSTYFIWQ